MSLSVWSLILLGIIVAGIYNYIPVKYRALYLTGVSLLVYFMWAGIYAFVVLCVELTVSAFIIHKINEAAHRKVWLITGILVTVIFLAFHKYKDFWIVDDTVIAKIIMPLGLSYYSFKIISYMIDSYRSLYRDHNKAELLLYVTFFPQIICGPISRAGEIVDQLDGEVSVEDVKIGLYLVLRGLFYKTVIADRLSFYTDSVFTSYGSHAFLALWMAALFYSIELYCDFAGYSYIVIGICRMMGLQIAENFKSPYFSASIREFWTRWHISLSSWLKDYIYIPLGGGRKGEIRRIVNTLIVFFVSGIWHGNTLVYVLWGLWHGIWTILSPKEIKGRVTRVLNVALTDIVVMFGWITFKTETCDNLISYISRMFNPHKLSLDLIVDAVMPFSNDYSSIAKITISGLFIFLLFMYEYRENKGIDINISVMSRVYIFAIVFFGIISQSSFIYANY